MSSVFFEELEIPEPAHNLAVSGGGHGEMTGRMLKSLEEVFLAERPDVVLTTATPIRPLQAPSRQ